MQRILVYIPTFNRPHELERQLSILEKELNDHPDVDLVVNDNCSTNYDFKKFTAGLCIPNATYRQNGANIGGNANIALSYTFWNNQDYMWILSDNDTLMPGAFSKIKSKLLTNPDLLSIINKDVPEEEYFYEWISGWNVPISEGIGLISSAIIKRDVFIKYSANAFFFHNSSFPHLAVILAALKDQKNLSIRRIPMTGILEEDDIRGGAKGNYELSYAGFPQITYFLPPKDRNRLIREWLHDQNVNFLRQKNGEYSYVYYSTISLIKRSSWFNGIRLWLYKVRFEIQRKTLPLVLNLKSILQKLR